VGVDTGFAGSGGSAAVVRKSDGSLGLLGDMMATHPFVGRGRFGAASSSCSLMRPWVGSFRWFSKGAKFTAAMGFGDTSTNLVIDDLASLGLLMGCSSPRRVRRRPNM